MSNKTRNRNLGSAANPIPKLTFRVNALAVQCNVSFYIFERPAHSNCGPSGALAGDQTRPRRNAHRADAAKFWPPLPTLRTASISSGHALVGAPSVLTSPCRHGSHWSTERCCRGAAPSHFNPKENVGRISPPPDPARPAAFCAVRHPRQTRTGTAHRPNTNNIV
jgi:hypothetical protein